MNNKSSKNEFLENINLMWKQGEISESALIKIRDMYCKENIMTQEEVLDNKLQNHEQYEQNVSQNQSYNSEGLYNNLEAKIIKEQYINVPKKTINPVYNKQEKCTLNTQYNNKIKSTNEKINLTKERNITIILSLGIALILLAGIILATSTWDLMSNGVKTIALFMVSILFFVISKFTEKKLKIIKTSFAFWILGNLFLPVILLSIGFFKLLGIYLSIGGEGRYIYGIISTIICLIFFGYSIKKYKNIAFTWIALIDSEILYWFVLKQLDFSYNMKLLMLLIYTVILTGVYHKFHKKQSAYDFVTKTIKWYVLINLILDAFQIFGSTIYFTFMNMIGEPKGYFQGIIIILGIIILASVITYWTYEFKFHGGMIVSGALILAIQIVCVIFRLKIHELPYYIVMHVGLIAIYAIIYYYNNLKYLKYIKAGTDIIILAAMGVLDLISILTLGKLYTAVLLYILAIVILITSKKAKNMFYLSLLKIAVPINLFVANLFSLIGFELISNIFSTKKFHVDFIYIILNVAIIYGISLILRLKKKNDYKIYFYEGHVFLGLTYFLTLFFQIDRMIAEMAIIIVAGTSFLAAKKDFKIRIYLYGLLTMITIILFDLEMFLHFNKTDVFILKPQNLFLCLSLILTIIWKCSKEIWRKKLELYITVMYSFGFLSSLIFNDFERLDPIFIGFLIGCIVIMEMFLYKSKKKVLMCIPIACFWIMSLRIICYFDIVNQILANCFVAGILITIGYTLYKIYEKISIKEMLYYNILAGLSLIFAVMISFEDSIPVMFNIFTLIVFGGFLYYITEFIDNKYLKRSSSIGCIVFNYSAYGRLISELKFLESFRLEFLLVPSIIVLNLMINYYFKKKNRICTIILRIWYSIVGIILLFFNQENSEFEAIILCGLCIISIIIGFVIQNKLYFIGGVVFLIIGVFLNTLSFWLNIPWWIYLLVGGTVLIFFASKNELNKGKKQDKKENYISKLLRRIKTW